MPVPKYKRGASRSKKVTAAWIRRSLKHLNKTLQFVPCANCGTMKLSHSICVACAQQGKSLKKAKKIVASSTQEDDNKTAVAIGDKEEAKAAKASGAKQGDAKDKEKPKADLQQARIEPKQVDLGKIKDTGQHPQERYQRKSF